MDMQERYDLIKEICDKINSENEDREIQDEFWGDDD